MPAGSRPAPADSKAFIAAGLLAAAGKLHADLTVAAATTHLRALLTPAALWPPAPQPPGLRRRPPAGKVPRWRAAPPALRNALARTLRSAWRAALPPRASGAAPAVLRLEVADAAAARQLAALGKVDRHALAVCVGRPHGTRHAWRWPLRIGVAPGARGERWRRLLMQGDHAALYGVQELGAGPTGPVDFAFVDADTAARAPAATCVVLPGPRSTPAARLARGCAAYPGAAFVIAAATPAVDWFRELVRGMLDGQPLDVALHFAAPAALIAADPQALATTTTGRRRLPPAAAPRARVLRKRARAATPPKGPRGAATAVRSDTGSRSAARAMRHARRNRSNPGHGESLIRSMQKTHADRMMTMAKPAADAMPDAAAAAAPAPPLPAATAPAAPAAPPARRLIAEAFASNRVRRKTLLPDTEHQLRVKIAIPAKGETAASAAFPERALPAGSTVLLTIHVSCEQLGLRLQQQVSLSTADRTQPSSIAVFPFRAPGEGSTVIFKILVTWQQRPLQEAHYTASVRSRAIRGDHAIFTAVPLSSSPEPQLDATPAQVSLEVNGANLVRSDTGAMIDLAQLRPFLDQIEAQASRVLAGTRAPETLADPQAARLLIKLARDGHQFNRHLQRLGVGDAQTLSLLVDATSEVLPLELVYASPPPRRDARLCAHCTGDAPAGNIDVCPDAGAGVVCPYAFWGQRRTIARTIRLTGNPDARPPPAPLRLRPVLYAAADRADDAAPANAKPSDLLQTQLGAAVGTTELARVDDWEAWVEQIRARHPQLLVVLGHTESSSLETRIEIGDASWLDSPEINAAHLRTAEAPPPLVVLLACASAVARDCFGGLPAAFTGSGAAAVVATLSKLRGPQGARAAAAVVRALCAAGPAGATTLGAAMTAARRQLLAAGLLVGLFLVSHGEIDLPLRA